MPRAGDQNPGARGLNDIHSPLRGLLDYTEPVTHTAQKAGGFLQQGMNYAGQQAASASSTDLLTQLLTALGLPPPDQTNASIAALLAPFTQWLQTLLGPNSPLNVANLFGLLKIGSTAITNGPTSLLLNGGFEGAISVQGGNVWTWDNTVYFLLPGQASDAAGSSTVTAAGVTRQLGSNTIEVGTGTTQVPKGQEISYSVQVLATGLVGTGTPVQMGVITNLGTTILDQALPAATPTGWTNPPTGSAAATLEGSYTVPDDGSVTWLRMVLMVTSTATAGTVRFGAAQADLIGGLLDQLQADIVAVPNAFTAFLNSAQTAITTYLSDSNFPELITALDTAWVTLWTTITDIEANAVVTVSQLLHSLTGINLTTKQYSQDQVNGLTSALNTLLPTTTYQSLVDAIANALGHTGTGHSWTDIETYLGIIPPANVGNVLGGANLGADVSTVHTTASNNATYAARKAQNDLILGDWLHTTYPIGSITDTAATRVGGKPTWWGAWNDNLALIGTMLGITAPTDPASDVGSAVNTNTTNVNTHLNNVVGSLLNTPVSAQQTTAQAAAAMGGVQKTVVALSSQLQQQQTQQAGADVYGQFYQVPFNSYPDTAGGVTGAAAFAQAPFHLAYSGAGTGYLEIANGTATWVGVSNGDRTVVGVYYESFLVTVVGTGGTFTLSWNGVASAAIAPGASASSVQTKLQAISGMPSGNVSVSGGDGGPYTVTVVTMGTLTATSSLSGTGAGVTIVPQGFTNTDYQQLHATIAGLPNSAGSKNSACLRMNAAGDTYVYGQVYLSTSLTLNWEVGCYVAGTKTVFASGTNAPLNFNFTLRAGVGGNPYRFQGVSGSQVVFDVIDSTHVSQLGSAYRYFGFRSDTANSGQSTPAPASYIGCSDNALPATLGSGFRMSCSSTTTHSISVATNTVPPGTTPSWSYFPSGFFDTIDNITPDMVPTTWNGYDAVEILTENWYLFELRCMQNATSGAEIVSIYAGYLRNGAFESIANGASVAVNVFGTQWAPSSFGGNDPIYCKAGDIIVPIIYADSQSSGFLSGFSIFGEANNRLSYWSMTRMFGT